MTITWRERVLRELCSQHATPNSEEFETVYCWLTAELAPARPPGWLAKLPDAVALALEIYRSFQQQFSTAYEVEHGPGELWVRQILRARLNFAAPDHVESIVDHIRDRRSILLDAFRRRAQPILFGERTFVPAGVRGYLYRVAQVESRHVPLSPIRNGIESLDQFTNPVAAEPSPPPSTFATQLNDFYLEHDFPRAQRLEAMTTRGLGFATEETRLKQCCLVWLQSALPAWEQRRDDLADKVRRLLARSEACTDPTKREKLEAKLQRLRERIVEHIDRLRPRPGQVQKMLNGVVAGQVGQLSFRRRQGELRVMTQRERDGCERLSSYEGLPDAIRDLMADVPNWISRQPPAPGEHGIEEAERESRRQQWDIWGEEGKALVGRLREQFGEYGTIEGPIREWLADAHDLSELGYLTEKGILGGMGSRHGWRLERLLRKPDRADTGRRSKEKSV